MKNNIVRFDWAMKRLLRQKANFVILEGFITSLLGRSITIDRILESEGNMEHESDKFNRVDLLAEDVDGSLIIIEIQNNRELDYFHRMLYGTSKAITEYIGLGDGYREVRKIYSINIVYFDLGQGKDYVYHGKTHFVGLHEKDTLRLSQRQKKQFTHRVDAGDIFPEYYVLRVDEFNSKAVTPLDEWIYFLKTGEIENKITAPGLKEAKENLAVSLLSEQERREYIRTMEAVMYQRSVIETGRIEGREEGLVEGREEGRVEGREEGLVEGMERGGSKAQQDIALRLKNSGIPFDIIQNSTGLSLEEINLL